MTQDIEKKSKLQLVFTLIIFGTIGLFRKFIPLDSGLIASMRGLLGGLFILIFLAVKRKPFSFSHLKGKVLILIIIGAIISFNWVCLFEAYRYTTVAVGTVCYYMQPIFLIPISAIVFKERITVKKLLCMIIAFAGVILVSGVLSVGIGSEDVLGVLFGLASGLLYALAVSANKRFTGDLDPYEKTMVELFAAGIAVIPYLMIRGGFTSPETFAGMTATAAVLLLILGVFHTGFSYVIYFNAVDHVEMQTTALLGYIDPAVAVLLSQLLLHEALSAGEWIGAILIIGAAAVSELRIGNAKRPQ